MCGGCKTKCCGCCECCDESGDSWAAQRFRQIACKSEDFLPQVSERTSLLNLSHTTESVAQIWVKPIVNHCFLIFRTLLFFYALGVYIMAMVYYEINWGIQYFFIYLTTWLAPLPPSPLSARVCRPCPPRERVVHALPSPSPYT